MEEERPRGSPGENKGRKELLGGRLACVVGVLLGLGGVVLAFLGAGSGVSAGVVGIGLGLVGYFLGARRLAALAVVVGLAALYFGLVASAGLIPGLGPPGHG